jgi:hypothetical protein
MSITSRTIAIVLAMALVAVISLAGTRAVFSVVTSNETNSFATGDIDLTDDDSDTIMFSVVGMFPGDTVEHCIGVTYSGPDGQATNGVKIYVPSFTDSATLADDLVVTIEEGAKPGVGFLPAGTRTGAGDGLTCAGFVNSATIVTAVDLSNVSFPDSYATGAGTWTPGASNPETLTYKITVTLNSASTAEGQSVTLIPFTWEVQAGS